MIRPNVISPLSICSQLICVAGQQTGSTVQIYAYDSDTGKETLIAEGLANWCEQNFPLKPGVKLIAGNHIYARQQIGNEISDRSVQEVIVESNQVLGPILFPAPLFSCAQSVCIIGAIPGSKVSILSKNNSSLSGKVRGENFTYSGNAWINVDPPIKLHEELIVKQDACGVPSEFYSPPAEKYNNPLTPPTIKVPLEECDHILEISNIVPGAKVNLKSSNGDIDGFLIPGVTKHLHTLPSSFIDGEKISINQELAQDGEVCKALPSDINTYGVVPKQKPPRPMIYDHLCVGSSYIQVDNLIPEAEVVFFLNGELWCKGESPTSSFTFGVEPLKDNDIITVKQISCGHDSDLSNEVHVSSMPMDPPEPIIHEPVYECAGVICVKNVLPGSMIYICSVNRNNASIGDIFAKSKEVEVTLKQIPSRGEKIFAKVILCNGTPDQSIPVEVVNRPEKLPIPFLESIILEDNHTIVDYITVNNIIPGAYVDIYKNNKYERTVSCCQKKETISISRFLQLNDKVKVVQRFSSLLPTSAETTVKVNPPTAKIVAKTDIKSCYNNGAAGTTEPKYCYAPITVTFKSDSKGYITDFKWSFKSLDTNKIIFESYEENTSYEFNNPGFYTVELTVSNISGSNSDTYNIQLYPHPTSGGSSGYSKMSISYCNSKGSPMNIFIDDIDLNNGTTLQDTISLPAEYVLNGNCNRNHPYTWILQAGHRYTFLCRNANSTESSPLINILGDPNGGEYSLPITFYL